MDADKTGFNLLRRDTLVIAIVSGLMLGCTAPPGTPERSDEDAPMGTLHTTGVAPIKPPAEAISERSSEPPEEKTRALERASHTANNGQAELEPQKSPAPPVSGNQQLTKARVVEARRKYQVQVLSFDASTRYGSEPPFSDRLRLRVTNNSDITLPFLTIRTNRLSKFGEILGWSRYPPLSTVGIRPQQTAECDYFPRGQLPGVDSITVEIEKEIAAEDMRFFKELDDLVIPAPVKDRYLSATLPRFTDGHGKPVGVGTFKRKDGDVDLGSTVTLFQDERRTRGVQIPRSMTVHVLAIRSNPAAPEDEQYDLVKVRTGAEEGWISRMQFASLTQEEPHKHGAVNDASTAVQSDAIKWNGYALLSPQQAGSVIAACAVAGFCSREDVERVARAVADTADVSTGTVEIRHVFSAVRRYASREVAQDEFFRLSEKELGRKLRT